MTKGEAFWKKYCGFLDLDFQKQVEKSRTDLNRYIERWSHTNQARLICPKGFIRFEDIPLTTYSDYPILHVFGERVERLSRQIAHSQDELSTQYYDRIYREAQVLLKDYLPDELGFAGMTAGTTGKPKWMITAKSVWPILREQMATMVAVACTDKPGTTNIEEGDKVLALSASAPYGSAYPMRSLSELFTMVPSIASLERVPNVSRKVFTLLRELDKGHEIKFAMGWASFFYMVSSYITQRGKLFKDLYESMRWGIPKIVMLLLMLQTKLGGGNGRGMEELLPLQGMASFGFEAELYTKFFQRVFNLMPLNIYVSTELGLPMLGTPERKRDLAPYVNQRYLEFLDGKGEVKAVDEVKKDEVYEIVGTPFWSCLVRYRTGDLLRVIGFRDDGLPFFRFESRLTDILDIYGYYRLTDAIAVQALGEAGFSDFDAWAFFKQISPNEHLELVMEKKLNVTEEEASRMVFDALMKVYWEFENYVRDFNIKKPEEAIKVRYLKKGAFARYMMARGKGGAAMGQAKAPKLITPEKKEIYDMLLKA